MQSPPADAAAPARRVLVVDDERALAQMVSTYLARAGYSVSEAYTGPDALSMARALDPDVIVLDLGLPGLDGVEVCRQIRTFSDCYVLMLTARGDEMDRIIGLSVGADDYITKPFSARELVARVQAVLRRPRQRGTGSSRDQAHREEPARVFGDLTIDPAGRSVSVAGSAVPLTRTEFDILDVLSARPKYAFSRRQLIDEVWDIAWVGDEHIVDVHVGHIRRKLGDDPTTPRYIDTVRGVGYRMGQGAAT
jgi:DNA-binding response OmpR family regulator